jgi:Fe2+ transport system protein FeoA
MNRRFAWERLEKGPAVQSLPVVENRASAPARELRLGDIPLRQEVELVSIDLPADQAEPLLERGVLPGCRICPVRSSPGGDPIVSVDGSLLALRRETADCLCVRILSSLQDVA